MIPYAEITEKADRRFTSQLLRRLNSAEIADDELSQLIKALQGVSDWRSFGPLQEILQDSLRPIRIREAAGNALEGMRQITWDGPADLLRRWWADGDSVLRRQALLCMDGIKCPDIVLQVARDAKHPWQADALLNMSHWFESPECQAVKIAALSHPHARVRAHAAYVLLFDEPVAAEKHLRRAASDDDPEVATVAVEALKYYPSQGTLRCLFELAQSAQGRLLAESVNSFQSIRGDILLALFRPDRRIADAIRFWLGPVWNMLAFTDEELYAEEPDNAVSRGAKPVVPDVVIPVPELLEILNDPDRSPIEIEDRLGTIAWHRFDDADRGKLSKTFLAHPDPLVRMLASGAFKAWEDARGLLRLLRDANFLVRKTAIWQLGQLPPMPDLARLIWTYLNEPQIAGVHCSETLHAFVKHAESREATKKLRQIADDPGRNEGLRVNAVNHLVELGAADVIRDLSNWLQRPPMVTWALHIALLEGQSELGLPTPNVAELQGVDNLDLQIALA